MSKLPETPMVDSIYPLLALSPSLREEGDKENIQKDINAITDEVSTFLEASLTFDNLFPFTELKFLGPASKAIKKASEKAAKPTDKNAKFKSALKGSMYMHLPTLCKWVAEFGDIDKLMREAPVSIVYADEDAQQAYTQNIEIQSAYPSDFIKTLSMGAIELFASNVANAEESIDIDELPDSYSMGALIKQKLQPMAVEIFGKELPRKVLDDLHKEIDKKYERVPAYMRRLEGTYDGESRVDIDETWLVYSPSVWWDLYRGAVKFFLNTIKRGTLKNKKRKLDVGSEGFDETIEHITTKLYPGTLKMLPAIDDISSLDMSYEELVRESRKTGRQLPRHISDPNLSLGQRFIDIMRNTKIRDKASWGKYMLAKNIIELMQSRTKIESNMDEAAMQKLQRVRDEIKNKFEDKGAKYIGTIKDNVDVYRVVLLTKEGKTIPLEIEIAPNKSEISALRKALAKGEEYPRMLDLIRMRIRIVGGKYSNQKEVNYALKYSLAYAMRVFGNTSPSEYADKIRYSFDQFGHDGFNPFSREQNAYKTVLEAVEAGTNSKPAEVQIGTDFPDHNHGEYQDEQFEKCKNYLGANSFRQFVFDLFEYSVTEAPKNTDEWDEIEMDSTDPEGPAYIQMLSSLLRILFNPDRKHQEMLRGVRFMTSLAVDPVHGDIFGKFIKMLSVHQENLRVYFPDIVEMISLLARYKDELTDRAQAKFEQGEESRELQIYETIKKSRSEDQLIKRLKQIRSISEFDIERATEIYNRISKDQVREIISGIHKKLRARSKEREAHLAELKSIAGEYKNLSLWGEEFLETGAQSPVEA